MPVNAPPYALAQNPFPLPALAAHAGKAALGGDREVAIACFVIENIPVINACEAINAATPDISRSKKCNPEFSQSMLVMGVNA